MWTATCSWIVLLYISSIILSNPWYFTLFHCQSPVSLSYFAVTLQLFPIHFTHFLPKQLITSTHTLIPLPSKLFIYRLFALKLFPFLFINFHPSLPNPPSIQFPFFQLQLLPHHSITHSLSSFPPHSHWATHLSCTVSHGPIYLLPHMLVITFSISFFSLPLRRHSIYIFLCSDAPSVSQF